MKGTKKVTIDGLERFTEEAGVVLNGLDEALDKVPNIKLFIQALSASGGEEVPTEAIGTMDFSQLAQVFELVRESVGNLKGPK